MLRDIFAAISLGRKLATTITDLRRDIHSVRSENAGTEAKTELPEALESRFSDIESQAREQHARVITLEQSLNEVLRLVARLGGFLGRKSDGEPGVKTIWHGLKEVQVAARTLQGLRGEGG